MIEIVHGKMLHGQLIHWISSNIIMILSSNQILCRTDRMSLGRRTHIKIIIGIQQKCH
jgi:hypothetical protein